MVTAAFFDLTNIKAALGTLEGQVAIAHSNLHFDPDPGQLEAWTITLMSAKEQADSAWRTASKVAIAIDDLQTYLSDFLYYEMLYHKLVREACVIGDALSNQRDIKHLKDVCSRCDGLASDTTSDIAACTAAAVEYVALTSFSFTKHDELKDPDLLPLLDKIALPAPFYFAKGTWLRGIPYLGYTKITGTIKYLESIAHRLHYVERRLKENMKLASLGKGPVDDTLISQLDDLDRCLTGYFDVLKTRPRSNEIQGGWFYLKTLQAYAKTVRVAVVHFQQESQVALGLHVSLMSRLVSYIKLKDMTLYPLYEMWLSLSVITPKEQLPHFHSQLTALLHVTTLARLERTKEEQAVPKCLFGGSWASKESLSGYVMKGLILALTFPPKEDPEFELVLAKCETSQVFKECLERSHELTSLYENYKMQREIKTYKPLLRILEWLESPVPIATNQQALAFYQFMRYNQALHALTEIKRQGRQTPRIAYVDGVLRQKDGEWQAALECPQEQKALFDALCKRLFAHSPNANKAIYENIKAEARSPQVTILLYAWALEELAGDPTVDGITEQVAELHLDKDTRQAAIQKRLLKLFFAAYEKDPVTKTLFTLYYPEPYLKRALTLWKAQ